MTASDRRKASVSRVLDRSQGLGRYDLGETLEGLASKLGRKPSNVIKLNSNENFFIPLEFLRELLREVVEEVDPRLYPGEETKRLRMALGEYVDASPDEIVIGAGGDQLIDLVSRIVLKNGDEALSISPTFPIYEQRTRIQGATYKAVALKNDFSLDVASMTSSITPKAELLFLCSPNNPTANQFDSQDIAELIEHFDGIVIIDEAYADFAGHSIVDLIREFENLIILRTFSKTFGLAGLRLGYSIANKDLATLIHEKYQLPYSVSHVALRLGLKLLEKAETTKNAIEELKSQRTKLIARLNLINGVRAFNSETNFVLLQVNRDSNVIYKDLLNRGVIVKNLGRVLNLENCLRVTVAPSHISDEFLACLKEAQGDMDA